MKPKHVTLYEVGARDGLQAEPQIVPAAQKIELIDRLFQRMDAHFAKKTSVMRALKSW